MKITGIKARQILDSRGNPTVEADVIIDNTFVGRAAVPSGASTGKYEALEMRDADPKIYHGQGVLKAVNNVNTNIAHALIGLENLSQADLDNKMLQLDGTANKSNLGADAILSVSLAYAWAVSKARNIPLFKLIGEITGNTNFVMPRPMMNIMNGGKHANWATDIQEYMVIPMQTLSWSDSLRVVSEIYHT